MTENKIDFLYDYQEALTKAKEEKKIILLQFHRDKCSGCKKLYSKTYLDKKVIDDINQWFIPLRQDILKDRKIRVMYSAVWTPSFYFINHKGISLFNIDGYLEPEDLSIVLRIGLIKTLLPRGKYDKIIEIADDGLQKYPINPRSSQLMFLKAMAYYLKFWDRDTFRAIMEELKEKYPNSAEAKMLPW